MSTQAISESPIITEICEAIKMVNRLKNVNYHPLK